MLGQKVGLSKCKKTEISNIFSDHSTVIPEINYKKEITVKNINMFRLKNILLNNECITEDIKEEIKLHLETNSNENMMMQNLCKQEQQF